MPLNDTQISLLKDIYEGNGKGRSVNKLVTAFKAGNVDVTQDSNNYTFDHKDHPTLTITFGKKTTPPMSQLPPKLRSITKSVLFENDPDFTPEYINSITRPVVPAPQ